MTTLPPTNSPPQDLPVSPPSLQKSNKRLIRAAAVVGGLVLLGGGFAAGLATGRSPISAYQNQVARMRVELRAEQGKLTAEQTKLSTEQVQLQTAQTNAQNAMSTALAQVRAQYKSRLAMVQSLQRKLQREQGIVQASTISADGVYVVGKDIPQGIYHTSGAPGGGSAGGQCYFATLGSTDTSNILDNNNFNGPETVDVSGAYAFQISGGCTWMKVG